MNNQTIVRYPELNKELDKLCAGCITNMNGNPNCEGDKLNCHHYILKMAQWALLNFDPLYLTNCIGMDGALRVIRAFKYSGELRKTRTVTI